jgi:hypothetical protein
MDFDPEEGKRSIGASIKHQTQYSTGTRTWPEERPIDPFMADSPSLVRGFPLTLPALFNAEKSTYTEEGGNKSP